MRTLKFELQGVCPLIMHSDVLVDVLHPLAKEKKKLTNKRGNKTEDDLARIDEIEFISGLYMQPDIGPVIPGANIERMIHDAAKRTKSGSKAKMGIYASEDYFALQYDGPRDVAGLWAEPQFQFRKSIKQGMSRIMRVRPMFHHWRLDIALDFDEKIFDAEDVKGFVTLAGDYVGLCDWRPRFGRFTAKAKG